MAPDDKLERGDILDDVESLEEVETPEVEDDVDDDAKDFCPSCKEEFLMDDLCTECGDCPDCCVCDTDNEEEDTQP